MKAGEWIWVYFCENTTCGNISACMFEGQTSMSIPTFPFLFSYWLFMTWFKIILKMMDYQLTEPNNHIFFLFLYKIL